MPLIFFLRITHRWNFVNQIFSLKFLSARHVAKNISIQGIFIVRLFAVGLFYRQTCCCKTNCSLPSCRWNCFHRTFYCETFCSWAFQDQIVSENVIYDRLFVASFLCRMFLSAFWIKSFLPWNFCHFLAVWLSAVRLFAWTFGTPTFCRMFFFIWRSCHQTFCQRFFKEKRSPPCFLARNFPTCNVSSSGFLSLCGVFAILVFNLRLSAVRLFITVLLSVFFCRWSFCP